MARPGPPGLGHQRLAEDALQHQRQLRPDLRLLMGGKNVNHAVDGGGGRVGVQRPEGQVAGFGDAQGAFDGLQVAHFADEHHVGVLAQGGPQGGGKTLGVLVPRKARSENQPIGALQREFGYDPDTVASHGLAFISGMQQAGVATTAKHFPGRAGCSVTPISPPGSSTP